jgi:hypothetical protein
VSRAAERGEAAFVSEAVRVVAGGDEQLRGGVVAHAVHCEQRSGDSSRIALLWRCSARASSSRARQRRATLAMDDTDVLVSVTPPMTTTS